MPAGGLQVAKRELVKVLVTVALFYSVRLSVNRDSADEGVLKAFRPVSLKVKKKMCNLQELTLQLLGINPMLMENM